MVISARTTRPASRAPRRGAALLMAMFFIFMVSTLVVNVMSTTAVTYSSIRNVLDYDRALYLANAGVHHACAELEASTSWRGVVAEGVFPANDSYTATVVDGASGQVVITAQGAAGSVTRTVVATVEL